MSCATANGAALALLIAGRLLKLRSLLRGLLSTLSARIWLCLSQHSAPSEERGRDRDPRHQQEQKKGPLLSSCLRLQFLLMAFQFRGGFITSLSHLLPLPSRKNKRMEPGSVFSLQLGNRKGLVKD